MIDILYSLTKQKITYVFVASILFFTVGFLAARNNYVVMTELREQVIIADRDNGDVETALAKLREHVYSHMNTDLTSGSNPIHPPIQLKGRYDRLMANEAERVKAENAAVQARGEAICGAQYPAGGFNAPRVACVQNYVSQNAVKENAVAEDLYKFDFVSPAWTPDLAGISLLVGTVLFVGGLPFAIARLIKRFSI